MGYIYRFCFVVAFGVATFFPNFGLLSLAVSLFHVNPAVVSIVISLWVLTLSLILPIRLSLFHQVSSAALIVNFAICVYLAASAGLVDPSNGGFWLTWGAAMVFAIIGWLLVSTPLWRLFHGVVAVQETEVPPEQ